MPAGRRLFECRIGIGRPDGPRASTWSTWAQSDGSVYIAQRDFGRSQKVSLHPPRPPEKPSWRFHLRANKGQPVIVGLSGQSEISDGRYELDSWPGVEYLPGVFRVFSVVVCADDLRVEASPQYTERERRTLFTEVQWIDDLNAGEYVDLFWLIGVDLGRTHFEKPDNAVGSKCIRFEPLGNGYEVAIGVFIFRRDTRPDKFDQITKSVRSDLRKRGADLSLEKRLQIGVKDKTGFSYVLDSVAVEV